MPDFSVRPYQQDDSEPIADLHRSAILAVSPRFYSPDELASWAAGIDPSAYARMAATEETFLISQSSDGRVIGFCSFRIDDRTGVIAGLYTAPEVQRRGVASALLKQAEQSLRDQGVTRFCVTASFSAMAFYEALGYQTVARMLHTTRGGLEIGVWEMEKSL